MIMELNKWLGPEWAGRATEKENAIYRQLNRSKLNEMCGQSPVFQTSSF
jgi:hypothetical protein